ncbi:hypothetical protein [Solibacillus sp. FSL W7-1324]|uniref:hypothetical protein n=1 Tax=Solibacillus sp. FSL W7-1324 TaxID=2921701 RepID=UPI0030F62F1F
MDMLAKKKCLDGIRLHKVRTKKLQIMIAKTTNVDVKKHLTKGLIWHIKCKRALLQLLINED